MRSNVIKEKLRFHVCNSSSTLKSVVSLLFWLSPDQGDSIPGEPGARGLIGFPGRKVSSAHT